MSSAAWSSSARRPPGRNRTKADRRMLTTRADTLQIRVSDDVVRVRQEVRARAVEVGLSLVDQTKIVTAASELARNALEYGGGGEARLESLHDGVRAGPRLILECQ